MDAENGTRDTFPKLLLHHARVRGNYAGFLTHCDRLFGTFARGYGGELAARRRALPAGTT